MRGGRVRAFFGALFLYMRTFVLFFGIIAFVITCNFLLFGASMSLSEAEVRRAAPAVFINTFLLAVLFVVVDGIRRKLTVDRPTREIQTVLKQLMKGDFSARISVPYVIDRENRFREIAGSINLLAEELSGVETLRADFIANVSHEMKTPLAVMQNYGTLLQSAELSDEKRIEYAKVITDSTRRLSALMTNILKLNRLENQQIYPQSREYDLGEQLCECLLQFERVWEPAEIDIETHIEESVIIRADEELLALVWNNLLSNAFKFTDRGGRVSVTLEADETYATVKVSDTGYGMTAEVGAHIFEKFYQGDTSHATSGNGLGLALVKRVVDIMHGEIDVESRLGEGSTFTVKIPRG